MYTYVTCLVAQMVKKPPAIWKTRFSPGVGKILCRREWQPTPGFLPGEFHGQRSLTGYSPWGCKESDTAERLGSAHDSTRNKPRLAAGAGVSTFKCTGWTGLGRERNEIRFNSC